MTTTELQVQLNWIKELQEGLEGGFKRAYIHSIEEYIQQIDKVVSYIPSSVKRDIAEKGEKYRNIDFRIPSNYDKWKGEVIDLFYSIIAQSKEGNEELYRKMELLSQEGMQDLGNIMRYIVNPSTKSVLPREEVKEIKLTTPLAYLYNRRKVNQEYWRDKPVTEVILTASSKYLYILENLKKGYVYVDGKDGRFKLSLTPQELPSSREEFYELIHHIGYEERIKRVKECYEERIKRVREWIDAFLERNYEWWGYDEDNRLAIILPTIFCPIAVPFAYIRIGKERKEGYLSYFRKMAITFSIMYLLTLGGESLYLYERANMTTWKNAHISSPSIEKVEYKVERKKHLGYISIIKEFPGIGLGPLYVEFLLKDKIHQQLLAGKNYEIKEVTITLSEGYYIIKQKSQGSYGLRRIDYSSIKQIYITLPNPLPLDIYKKNPTSLFEHIKEGKVKLDLDIQVKESFSLDQQINRVMHELEESLKNKRKKMKSGENESI